MNEVECKTSRVGMNDDNNERYRFSRLQLRMQSRAIGVAFARNNKRNGSIMMIVKIAPNLSVIRRRPSCVFVRLARVCVCLAADIVVVVVAKF